MIKNLPIQETKVVENHYSFSLWNLKKKKLTPQQAIDGLLVLERLLITIAQAKCTQETVTKIESKINVLLDII